MFRQFPNISRSLGFKRGSGPRLLGTYNRTKYTLITEMMASIYLPEAATGTAGYIKVWNGSSWDLKPVKVWTGSAWVTKPVKFWNGSAWALS